MLFAFTVYASVPIFLNILLSVPAALLLLPIRTSISSRKAKTKAKTESKHVSSYEDGSVRQDQKVTTNMSATPLQPGTLVVRPFVTTYRGAMLVATAVAILAVDFPIFPRRFAKVETWGTSLMDLGVGSFVFSAGVVSARTILRGPSVQQTTAEVARRMMQAFRHSIPLLVLGLVRLISVKNLDYAEHVTEYGVHWNFFFTLALLSPFVESVDRLLSLLGLSSPSLTRASTSSSSSSKPRSARSIPHKRSIRYDIVALIISLAYEFILNNTSLLSFILISPRTPHSSLLVKNREGVFSFIGYLAVFLSGRSTGILLCQFHHDTKLPNAASLTANNKKRTASLHIIEAQRIAHERKKVILPELALRALIYAALYWLSSSVYTVNLTVSRRLANLPYVLWIAAFNNAQLLLFAMIEMVGPAFTFSERPTNAPGHSDDDSYDDESTSREAYEIPSRIMRALNRNGLVVFLVANLLTGLVNFTVNTLDASSATAMTVLIPYAAAVTGVALALDRYGLTIKM